MNVLLLSGYHAASHARWTDGLVDHLSDHHFEVHTQPPRHFPWRHRGNCLFWAFDDRLRQIQPDAIVATSMVNLAGLRGLVPGLGQIPTLAYFHENQFAYPTRDEPRPNVLVTNLYTALAADRVLFNSPYNRRTFLEGAAEFLDWVPDQVPDGVVERLERDSDVLPVPLEDDLFDVPHTDAAERTGPIRIVWNHRWEHDKAPERFFRALFSLTDRFEFRLVVVGQQFREAPPIFEEARRRLDAHIDQWGYVETRSEYLQWLRNSDLVISTALHEFQGLAVQEAVTAGCLPVLPDRLAYPDFFDEEFLYSSESDSPTRDVDALAERLAQLLKDPMATRRHRRPDLSDLKWSRMADEYAERLRRLGACCT